MNDFFKSLWARLNTDLQYLWTNDKIFLVVFGVFIVLAKGSSLLIDLLANLSKSEVNAANKQDATLRAEETKNNNEANALIDQANALPGQEKPVDENWDKKK